MRYAYESGPSRQKIYENVKSIKNSREIREVLLKMAKTGGVRSSEEAADDVMAAVLNRENQIERITASSGSAAECIAEQLDAMDAGRRRQMVKAMNAALDGVTGRQPGMKKLTEGQEMEELLRKINLFSVSSRAKAARRLAAQVGKGKNCTVAATALGMEGYSLKCVAAMQAYVDSHETITPEQACAIACRQADMEALGDAIRIARITEKAVRILLLALLVVAVIQMFPLFSGEAAAASGFVKLAQPLPEVFADFADFYYIYVPVPPVEPAPALTAVLGKTDSLSGLFKIAWNKLPGMCGNLAVEIAAHIQKGRKNTAEGYETLCDYAAQDAASEELSGLDTEPDMDPEFLGDLI